MTACKTGISLPSWICVLLISSGSVDATAIFQSKASDSPAVGLEFHNITLSWTYSLGGTLAFASFTFANVTSGSNVGIAQRLGGGSTDVAEGFKERFLASIADSEAHLIILSVQRSDKGTYQFQASTTNFKSLSDVVDVEVQFKPEDVQLSTNITVNKTCPGSYWNFTCLVGAAYPEVTSYQLLENDVAVETGSSGMWIRKLSNSGVFTFKCLANNTVGATISANEKKVNITETASVVKIVSSSDTVIEGNSFNVVCNASGDPKLFVYWIKEDTDQRINGSVLNFTSINRNDSGTYRCEAENDCGSDSGVEIINVSYKPDIVELTVNATENTNCPDLWVNFTCVASEANPAVYNFLLYEKDGEISQSKSGMWIKKISKGGKYIYSCIALHAVGNITSLNNVTLTVNVSAFVNRTDNKTVVEGDSVSLNCNAMGSPDLFVAWSKIGVGVISQDRWLNISNITKADRGQYQCFANNTCGSDFKFTSINVQFKPENVNLAANVTTKETCLGLIVNFTCAADANPAVDKYSLYENDSIVDMDISGVWIRPLNKSGHVIYRCEANNSLGNEKSNSILFIVGVPASVNQIGNETVVEGDSVSLNCDATGSPDRFILWSKIGSGVIRQDRWLNITNITKADRGQYQCFANNTCGSDFKFTSINVQFKPENVNLTANVTTKETCLDWVVNFTCEADANPAVHKYFLYENDTIVDMDVSGVWIRPLNKSGHVIYRCEANNSLGNEKSNSILFIVGVPASVNQIGNETVVEGDSVSLNCNATGSPDRFILWSKIGGGVIRQDRWLNITSITKADRGQYQCFANNTCGSDVTFTSINVQYPPNITYISENMTVNQSESVNLTCRAVGNPKPNITWTKDGTIINSFFTVRGKRDEGLHVCTADNSIGNASSKSVFIAVEYFGPFNTSFTTLTKNPNIVYLNTSFNLSCSAQANPPASYRFYRGQESLGNISVGNTFETSVVQITCQVTYACTPFNLFGDGQTKVILVEVYYPPVATFNETIKVSLGSAVVIRCHVLGNPFPNITWYDGTVSGIRLDSREKQWNTTAKANETYLCLAKNSLGTATARVDVVVVETEGFTMNITLTISGMDCKDFTEELKERFRSETLRLLKPFGITEVVVKTRCGSVIVDLELSFTQSVTVDQVVETLKSAASQSNFVGFTVDPESIRETGKAVSTLAVPTETPCQESFIKKADCSVNVVIVAVLVVVAVIVVAFVAGVIGWWIHKRRKCRKDPRIHHSESEVLRDQNDIEDGAYARVNGGYADSGPPSANGTAQTKEAGSNNTDVPAEQAAAAPPAYAVVDKSKNKDKDKQNIPDYAVVDKSKKKKKKPEVEDPYAEVKDPKKDKDKDKKTADPSTHDYAMVDKSKKKKKETDENAYATVDKSKKSKKPKPKAPGEVLYADLGDFQPVQPLPTVSTSPEPLGPLKRPTPYQGTEYADITQFLKGNATLPEGQSTEMQPTYANAGGGQGAANKENASTGGEGDIEPKETPM